jgi:peptide/nickel transport system substrate-binding protein
MKDPLRPENSLPYLDGVRWIVIPDYSTRVAAMRTDKADYIRQISLEDRNSLLQSKPQLQYRASLDNTGYLIYMRIDKPELPFHDIRVRQALSMAIDRQAIKKDFYLGDAENFSLAGSP